jgi:hypothetical protein
MRKWIVFLLILSCGYGLAEDKKRDFYVRGAFYQDWMGFKSGDNDLYNRVSSRLKFTLWNRPGEGWTVFLDVRNRYTLSEGGKNRFIMYDVRISYDRLKHKFFLSLGQMNLYDTAGIGQLTGVVAGYKLNRYLSVGAYGGLQPNIYETKWDSGYNKYGVFVRYRGSGAKQFSASFNRIVFEGKTERQFLYGSVLLPLKRTFILYGNLEYELDSGTGSEDRLSRLFLNGRVNLSTFADITAHYSSGRGLDYHRYLLEQSQDPTLQDNEIERYYYNETYGVRLSIKPSKNIRFFASRRESEQKDRNIKNHTTGFGISTTDILKTGVSVYGYYNLNRGDASESDSYYVSLSRSFGKLTCNLNYANYFNGLRFISGNEPVLLHLPDHKTISAGLFYIVNRFLAFSLDYAYTDQSEYNEHQFFVRVILRK